MSRRQTLLLAALGLVIPLQVFAVSPDEHSVLNGTVYYDPNECTDTGLANVSGSISPDVGKGMTPAAQQKFQQILVAAGHKFNVDPNFIASFYFEENNTNQVDLLTAGKAQWREPAPPYGTGKPWPQSTSGDGGSWPDGTIGARGPFQFEPLTWKGDQQDGNGDGVKDPKDLTDAAFAAAYKLENQGGKLGSPEDSLRKAALAYNNATFYADAIMAIYRFLSGGGQSSISAQFSGQDCGVSNSGDVSGYQNPLRDIHGLTRMRIDEGVDYGGDGPVYAIGTGKVNIATTGSGWPGGNFVNYTLTDGPAKGKYVYVAENCDVAVRVGQTVDSNTVLCHLHNGYPFMETGWATKPDEGNLAAAHDVYSEGDVTAYGMNFSQLMKKLGAPAGVKDQPNIVGSLPSGWPTW